MNVKIKDIIQNFSFEKISVERRNLLDSLASWLKIKISNNETIRLNFICTHNSRRSHLAQIWAQTMASYFGIKNVLCYSGGTEATAMFPMVVEILINQGFEIIQLSENQNPVYAVKFDSNELPIICFSKTYDSEFNPKSSYTAIMTCDSADVGCPVVIGAEARFSITYNDPKNYDGKVEMNEKYAEKSLEIGQELFYVFSKLGL